MRHARLHVLPPLCPLFVSPADFTQAPDLLRRSHRATREWLGRSQDVDATTQVLALHQHPDRGTSMPHSA